MPIVDDWVFRTAKVTTNGYLEMLHVDGQLAYGSNTGVAPALNDYIYQTATGAIGRVIAGDDLGGTNATGTLDLTNVRGRFDGSTALEVLTAVNFDNVGNGGFKLGDIISDTASARLTVLAIEYNSGPKVVKDNGEGWAYGNVFTTGFVNNDQIDIVSGQTAVAIVHTGAEDAAASFSTAVATATLAVPGSANTNNSLAIHYDAGTIDIPLQGIVSDNSTGAQGQVQQKLGVTATGSLRLIDTSLSPAWTDDNNIDGEEVVFFNAQVAGQVFVENAQYEGQTSLGRFRVLVGGIIDDGDSTGKLWSDGVVDSDGAPQTLTINEDIHVILPGDILGVKIAEVEQTSTTLPTVAVVNIPDGIKTEQLADAGVSQGGVYAAADSLNVRRNSNALLTYVRDFFDEVAQLGVKPPLNGNVRNSLYTINTANDWQIPDLGFRFLEKGSWKDDGLNNLWTNYQSDATVFKGADVTDQGFLRDATVPRPMPDGYFEQGGVKQDNFWLEGPFDVIYKVKSTTDMAAIDPTTPALGQLISSGAVYWTARPFGRKYAGFDSNKVGEAATIVLDTPDDTDNNTGQYQDAFTSGGGGAFTVGEQISTADGTKRGIVTRSDTGTTGDVDYILLTDVQFVNTDVVVGEVSAKSVTFATPTNLVAGYSTDIRQMWIDTRFTGGTTTVATFIIGELVDQAVSSYQGYIMEDDSGAIYCQDVIGTSAPNATGQLTGATSGALNTPTGTNDQTTVPKDLGDGSGDLNYAGVISADITDASAQAVLKAYEWDKFLTDEKATALQGGRGTVVGVEGRFYRSLDPTFAEVPVAPYASFSGGIMSGAEANFIDKDTLALADLQNLRVTPIGGSQLTPPNLQVAQRSNLQAGWRVRTARSTGAGLTIIRVTEFQVGAGNAAGNGTIVLQAGDRTVGPLPADVPDTAVVVAEDPSNPGIFLDFGYVSINRGTDTVTLTSGTIGDVTGGFALTQGDDLYVAWNAEEATGSVVSNTVQYIGDVELVSIARRKGFDDVETAQTFINTGVDFATNRVPDGVVNLP